MDPLLSLAFSMQSNKGVYALLLGSGLSRAARIPTGWEVVLDLVRKLAAVEGEDCEPDPATWYSARFGEQPDYAKLLDALAKTPSERQQLLRSYFEPSDSERAEGAKMPTRAHRAIARLAASGYIRIIVTTNFDRLMERALEDEGVAPAVISTPDQVGGAVPLTHTRCCVLKIHGDYLDTRILNTQAELATYDDRINRLLDRVFDEFGLITCGWSAEWDTALRNAIERAPSRRYSMYWAAKGELSAAAKGLISRRVGTSLSIVDADTFFELLHAKVAAIEQFAQPHPLSVKAAVAAIKRYLGEPEPRIKLADLIDDEARRVARELNSEELSNMGLEVSTNTVTSRVRKYDSLCAGLVGMAAECGRWGDERVAENLARMQRRLYATRANSGLTFWLAYQRYPVALTAYAALLGASLSGNISFVRPLLVNELGDRGHKPLMAADVIPPFCMLGDNPKEWGHKLEGKDRAHAPLNDWLADVLWLQLSDQFVSRQDFELHFDWVEVLLALSNHKLCAPEYNDEFHPPGAYGYRRSNHRIVLERLKKSLDELGAGSPYVVSKLFGDTPDECRQAITQLEGFASKLGRSGWW
jgi:hypothetical protein